MSTQTVAKIPVVDFSDEDYLKPGTSSWLTMRKDVCHALEELGCFVAILPNKVPKDLHNTFFGTFDELFSFPIDTPEKPFRAGYVTARTGQRTIGIINATSPEQTHEFTDHFWPNGNDQFRESADLYTKVMADLDQVVTRMVFENYGVEKYHHDHIQSTLYNVNMIKYRELVEETEIDVVLRTHTDRNFSTIILQNHVNGLEINIKDDEWVGFEPLPSSVIFIAADAFQVWSNGRIRACRHRVTLRTNEVRCSFGVFALKKGMIEVPDELVDKDHPLKYKPMNHLDFLKANPHAGETEYAFVTYCAI